MSYYNDRNSDRYNKNNNDSYYRYREEEYRKWRYNSVSESNQFTYPDGRRKLAYFL